MALSIIRPPARPDHLPKEIKRTEEVDHDRYQGPLASMLAAGIIRAEQLPPEGKQSIAYFQGQVILRKCKRDETYLRITVFDPGNTVVLVGVSHDVGRDRRKAETLRQIEARKLAEQREAMRDPGIEVVRAAMHDSPARFKVGELCLRAHDGCRLEITGEYMLYRVLRDDGKYMAEDGKPFDYLFGYTARELGEDRVFYPAHELLEREGRVKHLTLVAALHKTPCVFIRSNTTD